MRRVGGKPWAPAFAALLLVSLALLIAPRASAQTTTVWSATLTMPQLIQNTFYGCSESGTSCSTALTDNDFTYDSVTYQIQAISFARTIATDPWSFDILFDKAIPPAVQASTLHFGSRQFSLASATLSNSDKTVTWSVESSYALTANQTISMSLQGDFTSPTVNSAAVNGTTLTITFNESSPRLPAWRTVRLR